MEKFEVSCIAGVVSFRLFMRAAQVVRSIGSGSFGCALLCREKSSGTMVVIKQVAPRTSSPAAFDLVCFAFLFSPSPAD